MTFHRHSEIVDVFHACILLVNRRVNVFTIESYFEHALGASFLAGESIARLPRAAVAGSSASS